MTTCPACPQEDRGLWEQPGVGEMALIAHGTPAPCLGCVSPRWVSTLPPPGTPLTRDKAAREVQVFFWASHTLTSPGSCPETGISRALAPSSPPLDK